MDEQHQHLRELRQTHLRRLRELEKQAAAFGLNTPPEIRIEIIDIRAEIARIDKQLGIAPAQALPLPAADFTGRIDEITQLVNALSQSVEQGTTAAIIGVRGMGGIGKTELALAVAHQLAPHFPDAQILVELRGASSTPLASALALQTVIRTMINVSLLPDDLAQLQIIYRETLAGKRVFILADDAKDVTQVRPLVPPPGCALLITSRQRFYLPKMAILNLETLPPNESQQLLLTICPRIGDHASQLATLCGHLPLALRVSASLLANDDTRNVERYLQRVGDEHTRLAELHDPDDPTLNVEASIQLSYDALDAATQKALCQLSRLRGYFNLADAKTVIQVQDEEVVEETLLMLRRRSLLEWDAPTQHYSLHDLIRLFVAERLPQYERDDLQAQLAFHRHRLSLLLRQPSEQVYYGPRLADIAIKDTQAEIEVIKSNLRAIGIPVTDEESDKTIEFREFTVSRTSSEWRIRYQMLRNVRNFWVKGVLEASLSHAMLIELGLEYKPDALTDRPWDAIIQQDHQAQSVLLSKPIIDVFDESGGELLILGAPGSGKTTLLLELASDLISRAEQDEHHPIPVVFNLSSWDGRHRSLAAWLVDELSAKYYVPRKLGQSWVAGDQVLPLLDGLDEVRPEHRAGCTKAISAFRRERGFVGLAVCSRVAEYETLLAELRLHGTVHIQDFTLQQVNNYLTSLGDRFASLQHFLTEDLILREMAQSPLMLNILVLAYQGMTAETLSTLNIEEQRKKLFDAYVNTMFARPRRNHLYTREQTFRWLTWFARTMKHADQTVIQVERISFTQRLAIRRSTGMPWHATRFLDYCADLNFLRKVGHGYIFVHRLLMEYFASLDAA